MERIEDAARLVGLKPFGFFCVGKSRFKTLSSKRALGSQIRSSISAAVQVKVVRVLGNPVEASLKLISADAAMAGNSQLYGGHGA